jgi:hypothetical protein
MTCDDEAAAALIRQGHREISRFREKRRDAFWHVIHPDA